MSITALTLNIFIEQPQQQSPLQQVRQDFQQLASALQSGDLTGAQSAYSSIEQFLQAASNPTSDSSTSNTLQNDFSALGQALQAGDLNQAQSAFSQLQSDSQAAWQSQGAAQQSSQPAVDTYVPSQNQDLFNNAVQDYSQLAASLQSGNLAQAQSTYSNLQELISELQNSSGSTPTASTTTTPSSTSNSGGTSGESAVQTDFANLGQDLQSGNLSAAQSDFSQLQSDLQSGTSSSPSQANGATQPLQTQVQGHHGHHHHHQYSGGSSNPTSSSSSSDSSSLTINLYI